MTGRSASFIWLLVLGLAVGLFAAVWVVPQLNRIYQQTQTIDGLEAERENLAARVQDLTLELNRILTSTGEEPVPPPAPAPAPPTGEDAAKRLVEVRLLAEAQDRLADATDTIEDLKLRVGELESAGAALDQQKLELAATGADLQERLTSSENIVAAMQAELKTTSDRLMRLEARNRALREENREANAKITRIAKLSGDLENVHRRQEELLQGIVQRYQSVTDQYRSAALRLNNPEQDTLTTGIDLSRIENTLNLAEEDLKQLGTLSSQAARIQRQLTR